MNSVKEMNECKIEGTNGGERELKVERSTEMLKIQGPSRNLSTKISCPNLKAQTTILHTRTTKMAQGAVKKTSSLSQKSKR